MDCNCGQNGIVGGVFSPHARNNRRYVDHMQPKCNCFPSSGNAAHLNQSARWLEVAEMWQYPGKSATRAPLKTNANLKLCRRRPSHIVKIVVLSPSLNACGTMLHPMVSWISFWRFGDAISSSTCLTPRRQTTRPHAHRWQPECISVYGTPPLKLPSWRRALRPHMVLA